MNIYNSRLLDMLQFPVGLCDSMDRNYVTSATAFVILLCACVVMAADDVIDKSSFSSSSSSSKTRDSLPANILGELRRHLHETKDLQSQLNGLTPDEVSDHGELETKWLDKSDLM